MAQLLSHLETKAGSHLVSGLSKDQVSFAEACAVWNLSGWAEVEGNSAKGQLSLVARSHKPEAHAGLYSTAR